MKKIIANKDFIFNKVPYIKGDEVEVKNIKEVKLLNEKGFIIPLGFKDLTIIERELKK